MSKRNPIEWAMWANVLGVGAGAMMALGGTLSVVEPFPRWELGIFAIAAGTLIFTIEWARSKKQRGNTMPRSYQNYITPVLAKFGILSRSYFVRSLLYMMLSVPNFFELPLVIGGVVCALTAIVYFYAALKDEHWEPLVPRKRAAGGPKQMGAAPDKPPPRLQQPGGAPPRKPVAKRNTQQNKMYGHQTVETVLNPIATRLSAEEPAMQAPVLKKPAVATRPSIANKPKPRPKPKPAPKKYAWTSAVDPNSGDTYYINMQDNSTTWDKPQDWDEHNSEA